MIAQIDSSVKREVGQMIIEGIGELAPNPVLKQYQNTRSCVLQDWLESDTAPPAMLVLTRFAETSQVHCVRQPLGCRRQLTFFDDPVASVVACPARTSPWRDCFLFLMDEGGNENYQIYLYHMPSGKYHLLTDGRSRHVNVVWNIAGTGFAFSSNAHGGKDMLPYLARLHPERPGRAENWDGHGGPPVPVFAQEGTWTPLAFSPDDGQLLVKRTISSAEAVLHLLACAPPYHCELVFSDAPARTALGSAVFRRDGGGFYLTTDRDADVVRLVHVDLQQPAAAVVVSDGIDWDVGLVALSARGSVIVFTANTDGVDVLYVVHEGKAARRVCGGPAGVVQGLAFVPGSECLVGVSINGPQTPGDCYTVDLDRGEWTRWTESEVGGLDVDSFIAPQVFRYRTFDDREIPALLYLPPTPAACGKHPVILYLHGGPASQVRPSFNAKFQYYLIECGVAIVAPNVRGSTGYGKAFMALDDVLLREDSVKDVAALLAWIGTRPDLDARRVVVDGGSYGGYMSYATVIACGPQLRGGISRVGITHWVTFLENTSAHRRDLRREEYGDERRADVRAFLERISPLTHVDRIAVPMLLAAGANDPRVPVAETRQIARAMVARGLPCVVLVAGNEGHGFQKKANLELYMTIEAAFVQALLSPE